MLQNLKHLQANFCCLPKVHKSEEMQRTTDTSASEYIKISKPPILSSRSICAGPNCHTNKLSNLSDIILKPMATKVKSYVRDEFDFLNNVPRHIDFDSTLVTIDVTTLYTNIPNDLAIEAIGYWVDNLPESLIDTRFTKDFICEGISIFLENNYFIFDGEFYRQLRGLAMGTKVAVILAILTMGFLELKLYNILRNYFPMNYVYYIIENWKRFIDGCRIIWNNCYDIEVFTFILNKCLSPSIKFTREMDKNSLPFLDILVLKSSEGNITLMSFTKRPTLIVI